MPSITHKKKQIVAYWLKEGSFDLDEDIPQCFACGCNHSHWTWAKNSLQVAHIVARSQEGIDDVENLILLCYTCHGEAPMTVDREDMLHWCHNRESHLGRRLRKFDECLKSQGIDLKALPNSVIENLASDASLMVREMFDTGKVGLHPGGDCITSVAYEFGRAIKSKIGA